MKFKSTKSLFIIILVYGLSIFMIGLCIEGFVSHGVTFSNLALYSIMLCSTSLLLFLMLYYTGYELRDNILYYHSGIVKGEIAVSRITEVIKGKTLYVGLKPATGTKGLIIKYDKYEEIYISPQTNDTFIDALLKIKSDIVITNS